MSGTLRAIWIKRAKRGPMDPAERGVLVAERGLAGNADQGRRRQVTLIEEEVWSQVERELGARVPPTARRANLMISGIPLPHSRGRMLVIGPTRLRVLGETVPCERMDEAFPGLRRTLKPGWRGGVFAEVVTGGEIAVGDEVAWEEEALPTPA